MQNSFTPSRLAWLVALGLCGAQAQESTIVLGEVTVSASNAGSLPTRSILTSVDVMGAERVQDKNVANSWELIGQMPGIQLTEFRLGAESGKPSFRAFNGEGYINGIKLLIDGVPSNVNSGNMRYLDMIFPLDIDYVEVVRGTNDPRYGLHNIGGNINVATRQSGNYTDGRLTLGSFNTQEVQAALGRESGGFAQNYFIAKQDSDGYRDHARSEKYSLGGKWFYTSDGSHLKAGLIARIYHQDAESPGYLTAGELDANRFQSPARSVAVDGQFRKFTSQLNFDPAKPTAAKATFEVELASVDTGAPEGDQEVAGKPWFNTKAFPTAKFVSGAVKPLGGNKYEVGGQLTIKGKTQDVVVPATRVSMRQAPRRRAMSPASSRRVTRMARSRPSSIRLIRRSE